MIDVYNESELNTLLNNIDESGINEKNESLGAIEQAYLKAFPSLWAMAYKPIKNKPTTFMSKYDPRRHRPWQIDILNDRHKNIVIQKSRQLGISEVSVTKALWFADSHDETKIIYTFPRDAAMKDFSNTRLQPAINGSEYLTGLMTGENNVALKKIGNSYIFLRSAYNGAAGEGVDADYLALDEYDRMMDGVEFAFQESLRSSKYGNMARWSTPTITGRGINKHFDKSDKRYYMWKCEHCGEYQTLTYEDNIIQVDPNYSELNDEIPEGTFIVGCKKCKREINRMGCGEYVAERPHIKDTRGYMVSQLDAAWITADDIKRREKTYTSKQLFYNYVLGHPYESQGLVINENDIRDSIRLAKPVISRTQDYPIIVAGIDWGNVNWLVITGIKANGQKDILDVYWFKDNPIKPLEPVARFVALLKAYEPNLIVADAGFGADRNSYLFQYFPKALFSCQFLTIKNPESRVKFINQWNENGHEVTVDKTTVMQRMLHTVKARGIGMFQWQEKIAVLAKHLQNVRIIDQEDNGVIYQMATRIGPDHLGCALCYCLIGCDKLTNYGMSSGFEYDYI